MDISLPVIGIDLDGVIHKSYQLIPQVEQSFKLLRRDLREIDPDRFSQFDGKIPLLCVTNSGGCVEQKKVDKLNQILSLDENQELKKDNMILNFTPLRTEMLKFSDKVVLISGTEDYISIAEDCGLTRYITFMEFATIYYDIMPTLSLTKEDSVKTLQIVTDRIGAFEYDPQNPIQIHAIFYLYDCINLETIFQITCDLLTTENGLIADKLPQKGPNSHIPIYSVTNDYMFPSRFKLLRMGFGIFIDALKDVIKIYNQIHRKVMKTELNVTYCGKPSKMTFEYAEQKGIEMCQKLNAKPSRFYMIGDNPHTDIRGAKLQNWFTILVTTGVYQKGDQTLPEETPDAIVHDFTEALRFIAEMEKIKII